MSMFNKHLILMQLLRKCKKKVNYVKVVDFTYLLWYNMYVNGENQLYEVVGKLAEGVRKVSGKYVFDYEEDKYLDLINLTGPDIYKDKIFDNVYWFGYRFTDDASRQDRSDFINYLKGLQAVKPSDKELERFINKPLVELHKIENITSINCIIHPRSERSTLTAKIVSQLNDVSSRDVERTTIELIKNLPQSMEFDWKRFFDENDKDVQQILFIQNTLLPKIHSLDYFSLAKNVKPKYRRYIQNFLRFSSRTDKKLFKSINKGKVLIVDDINTSGSTINEILRMLNEINPHCKIYIFTLIGK